MKDEKYKVGDLVTPLIASGKEDCTSHNREVGQFYTVSDVDKDGLRMNNKFGKNDGNGWIKQKHVRHITSSELVDEAKMRYPIRTRYYNVGKTGDLQTVDGLLKYYLDTNNVTDGQGGSVYRDGIWAEIVSIPTLLTREDLIEGEIYLYDDMHISIYPKGGSICIKNPGVGFSNEDWVWSLDIKHVDSSDKDWLRACIAANKFILKEDALKKEEFVLPGKWCVRITKDTWKDICKYTNWTFDFSNYMRCLTHYKTHGGEDTFNNFTEITFEQFKKHVLKTPEEAKFEVGKWYKINNCWYAKFMVIHGSGTYWRHSDVITTTGNFCKDLRNLSGDWKSVSIELLTDLSEIQKYLPEGHPDKIKDLINVGDGVECISDIYNSCKFSVGKKYTITNISCGKVTFAGEANSCYSLNEFKLYKKKEVEKWSVGTYVVTLAEWLQCASTVIGGIYKIKGVSDSRIDMHGGFSLSYTIPEFGNKLKWFATKEEAEAYSKSITNKVEGECLNTNSSKHDSCGEKYGCKQHCDECEHYSLNQDFEVIEEEPNDFKQASDVSDWLGCQQLHKDLGSLVSAKPAYIPMYTEPTTVQKVEELVLIKPVIKIKIY